MKLLARQVVWWPGIDTDITSRVQNCDTCQINQKNPPQASVHPWEWPKRPWARIHIDHLGPVEGKTILVVVDAHSKWMEAVPVSSTSSILTIRVLRNIIATHGLPELIISDNGTSFTSEEFQSFVRKNGIKHRTSAPYHPATNGLAERAVQVIKSGLRKNQKGDLDLRLAKILFNYRNIPHSTTGATPAELLMGRKPRTLLDLLHPDLSKKVEERQAKEIVEPRRPERLFAQGDLIYVRNFGSGNKWIPAEICEVLGPRNYQVKLSNGRIVKRHLDQIRLRSNQDLQTDSSSGDSLEQDEIVLPLPLPLPQMEQPEQNTDPQLNQPLPTQPSELRRSTRVRQPPDYYRPVQS